MGKGAEVGGQQVQSLNQLLSERCKMAGNLFQQQGGGSVENAGKGSAVVREHPPGDPGLTPRDQEVGERGQRKHGH